jgi:DNA-directed RNA polymerase subunit RPC12/RpoP
MVLVLIGIAIGVILIAVLIIKAFKTSSHDIVGMDIRCKKCGIETNGLACPKCEKKSQSFGV